MKSQFMPVKSFVPSFSFDQHDLDLKTGVNQKPPENGSHTYLRRRHDYDFIIDHDSQDSIAIVYDLNPIPVDSFFNDPQFPVSNCMLTATDR